MRDRETDVEGDTHEMVITKCDLPQDRYQRGRKGRNPENNTPHNVGLYQYRSEKKSQTA